MKVWSSCTRKEGQTFLHLGSEQSPLSSLQHSDAFGKFTSTALSQKHHLNVRSSSCNPKTVCLWIRVTCPIMITEVHVKIAEINLQLKNVLQVLHMLSVDFSDIFTTTLLRLIQLLCPYHSMGVGNKAVSGYLRQKLPKVTAYLTLFTWGLLSRTKTN